MPPSHHSSSHHSSSHHSSSSSRSSSRSYSYHSSNVNSFRTGPSAHSSTSHYGSSHGTGRNGDPRTNVYHQTIKPRVNQPRGYHSGLAGYAAPRLLHCKMHDYYYYSTSWDDSETGKHYRQGYYDENGNYYDTLILNNDEDKMQLYSCEYCGTEVKLKWKEGEQPSCPNCGAKLEASSNQTDEEVVFDSEDNSSATYGYDFSKRRTSKFKVIFIFIFITALLSLFLSCSTSVLRRNVGERNDISNADDVSGYSGTNDNIDYNSAKIYVEELGRFCEWYDEYDSYYDKETDCYFYYSDYGTWQYWYEGISSDYGDYGWMEYDENEENWYIETEYDNWEILPSMYATDRLWHM